MIILVLLSLVLLGIAVALVARGVMVSRFRTVDTLEQIGRGSAFSSPSTSTS